MKIRTRQFAEVTMLDVGGRVVAGEEATLLHDSIRTLLALGEKNIILNLGDVPYIDSAGIGELASAYVAIKKAGGSLALLNLTRRVREVLQIVHLVTVFQVFESEADALSAFKSSSFRPQELVARAG